MPRTSSLLLALCVAACVVLPARAEDAPADEVEELRALVLSLQDRIQQLEFDRAAAAARRPASEPDVTISGSSTIAYFSGREDASTAEDSFQLWDTRLFFDASLARKVGVGERVIAEHASFSFEWNLLRLGRLTNDVGDLFLDLRGLGGRRWLNLQVGRFQIPVGENYLRFDRGYASNPFISNTVAGPWFWDEGLRLFGGDDEGRFGYVTSFTDGENSLNADADADKQVTLKLWARPFRWLYLSASGLRTGQLGSPSAPAESALWWGEGWARAFGSGTAVPSYQDGAVVADGPNELRDVVLVGGDAILSWRDAGRLWLAYGGIDIDSEGPRLYDRRLRYWIAELILEGRLLAPSLAEFYLALRGNGVGTYDRDEGYLLDIRSAWTLGYNMTSLEAYSLGLGWHLADRLDLRLEYTLQDVDLVRGVPDPMRDAADRTDYFGAAFGVRF